MKKTLLTLLAAAIAGCSSGPNWDTKKDQDPIVLEETPKTPEKKEEKKETDYETIELAVAYKFENGIAAKAFNGYIKLLEKEKGSALNEYQKMIEAFQVGKEGVISSKDISDTIKAYGKGAKEVKIPVVTESETERVYIEKIKIANEEVGGELAKMLEGKKDAEKVKIAEAVRSIYNGNDPITASQLKKIQEKLN